MNTNDTDSNDSDDESWWDLRNERIEIDNHQCSNCGSTGILQVHHVVPKNKGGVDELSNLRTLCTDCHNKAHNETIGGIKAERNHYHSSDTRWLPTIETVQHFVDGIDHPLEKAVVMMLAKTGIGVEELASLELEDIYLRGGGLGHTSTIERPTHPFFILHQSENGPSTGYTKRLCDTYVPIGPELARCMRRYLAIRPDSPSNNFLVGTNQSWGEELGTSSIRHIVRKHAEEMGLYEVGAGESVNLTPNVFHLFFKNRYQGQPAVRDYIVGKKKEMPFTQSQIATDYRESIYDLLD